MVSPNTRDPAGLCELESETMTLKEAHKKALIDAGWAMCKEAGGAGPGGCDPKICVCHGDAIAPVFGYLLSLEASGFVIVPKEATTAMLSKCETAWRERMKDKLSRNAIGEGGVQAPFVENWRVMLAARPALDDE